MIEAALYILTGLALYAGGHHLYLATARSQGPDWPRLQLGGLYWLLSGFALTTGITYHLASLDILLPAGKLGITFGLLLWTALIWHVAWRTGFRPLFVLDLFTTAWLIFLVRNLSEPNSLLYADVTPVNQTLLSGETRELFYTSISPWWTAVEVAMMASLVFCFYACYRLYRQGRRRTTLLTLLVGLALLSLVTLHDHLVSARVIDTVYLAPFGFALFLLPASLHPLWRDWRRRRAGTPAPVIRNLAYMPDQASFHTDVSQLRRPVYEPAGPHRDSGAAADSASVVEVVETPEQVREPDAAPASPVAAPKAQSPETAPAAPVPPPVDVLLVSAITDSLIDIAVYATMALNRFKRGDADPQTLESLCRRIRTQAIKTRRVTHKLIPEELRDDAKRERS